MRAVSRAPLLDVLSAASIAAAAAVLACGGPDAGRSAGGEARTELRVSAAASLTDAFADVEAAFEAARPEVDLVLNLAGSSTLRMQILEGAPVDVYAPADTAHMRAVVEAGQVAGEPRIFATNRLEIAVPAGNPAGVEGLADFARGELVLGLCAEGVPCGDFARRALAGAGVAPAPDTNEPDVRALLTKLAAGELDAGIVYLTDVAAAGERVDGVPIPDSLNVLARYPIAVLRGARRPEPARALLDFVLSEEGRAILRRHGFGTP